ncbi:penicillin-binding protein [Streptomyces sp. NBC_01267]|uniref:transglycosylase domain-containing protein n=1 Tax=unclassified Streptomyces TaxID=2593676 RepID=UPI0020241496|nr:MULTISPECIES: transglycosylase domain-containing protein [unclassified Streptomyces]MCX4549769.1 penicillin-binding protein [Streptomyces sp. NBC_01500]WSC21295.1 penicillin-binding protein [Streptomyces sp. NBC_01766]WSV55232.1 penicillin-binding protein [Streptomyces sp. NBC_01014]
MRRSLLPKKRQAEADGRRRLIDYPRRGRAGLRRWLPSWRLQLGTFLLCAGSLAVLFAVVYARIDIPDENAAARQEANVYYWADGSQMVATGAVDRQLVPLAKIPLSVQHSVVAAENASFYSDAGVSVTGQARAVVNMVKGQDTQGGSTITQQYVKNTYLSRQQTYTRKFKEFFIALKLSRHKSKDDILQGYLNTSWFGRGAYGIQAAAGAYYGVPAKDLDPSQAAMLAALLKGSEQFDPTLSAANHKRAVARWGWILDRQVTLGMMSPAERATYRTFPEPKRESRSTSMSGQTGYLVGVANGYLKKRIGLDDKALALGGYQIHTTFEKDKVERLRQAVEEVTGHGLAPKKRAADRYVEVGAASVRPEDGAIVALYGGADATQHFTDNADTTGVPVGSAFKPFALAAYYQGMLAGGPHTLRVYPAIPDPKTLEHALVTSAHAPFVQLGKSIGWKQVRDTAVQTGLLRSSMAPLEQTFPTGTSTPSAIRMADAYATFANYGTQSDPYSVTRVLKGRKTLDGLDRPRSRRVLQPKTVAVVNQTLQDVARTTGAKSVVPDVASIATGTSDRTKSAWFVGYTKELSTAVTLFRNKPGRPQLLPLQGVGGADSERGNVFPPRIWARFMGGSAHFTLNRTGHGERERPGRPGPTG